MKARLLALWPLLIAIVALLVVYLPPVLAGRFWAPGDGIIQVCPQRVLAGWALLHGQLPFWNPFMFGGMPFFASAQVGMLSPLSWPGYFLDVAGCANLTIALGFAAMLGGLWAFTRALGLPPVARGAACIIFPLGGFLTAYSGNPAIQQSAALLPWLLWALERHAQAARARWLGAAGLLAAWIILAGHPQTAAYALLVAGAFALVRGEWRGAAARAAALGLGAAMAAVQLVPTLDLVAASNRRVISYDWLTIYSVPPQALPTHLFPLLFGARAPSELFPVKLWSQIEWWGYMESHVGVVAWLLALVALGRCRERMVAFWACVAGTGLILTMGSYTPAYRLWALLPFVKQMPYASRHGLELTFAIAILAAYGVAALLAEPNRAKAWLARAAGTLGVAMAAVWAGLLFYAPGFAERTQPYVDAAHGGLAMAWALGPTQPAFWVPALLLLAAWGAARLRPALLLGLLAIELGSFNLHNGVHYILPADRPGLIAAPSLAWGAGRSLTVPVQRYPDCTHCDLVAYLLALHYPDLTVLAGERTVNGYDAFVPARYGDLLGMDSFGHAGERDPAIFDRPHHALDLAGLTVLRLEAGVAATPAWRARLAGDRFMRRPDEPGLVVLGNPRALPAAWRPGRARVLAPAAVDAAVRGQTPFDPRDEALLEGEALAGPLTPGSAQVEATGLSGMALTTDGAGPGLVLISSNYDAGWRAWDAAGGELPVRRADGFVLAVQVPAGPQRIQLTYRPARLGLGLTISAVAAAGLGALVAWLGRRRRRQGAAIRS